MWTCSLELFSNSLNYCHSWKLKIKEKYCFLRPRKFKHVSPPKQITVWRHESFVSVFETLEKFGKIFHPEKQVVIQTVPQTSDRRYKNKQLSSERSQVRISSMHWNVQATLCSIIGMVTLHDFIYIRKVRITWYSTINSITGKYCSVAIIWMATL